MFTFYDELIHAFNAHQIDVHKHLFHSNPILRSHPLLPGSRGRHLGADATDRALDLRGGDDPLAVARVSLSAPSSSSSRRISGSAQVAGLGAALYACNFNFLFYGAQYSYESLALPLLVVVLMLLAEREAGRRGRRCASWAAPIGLAIAAVVVTHHLTSYALVVISSASPSPSGS